MAGYWHSEDPVLTYNEFLSAYTIPVIPTVVDAVPSDITTLLSSGHMYHCSLQN